MLRSWRVLTLLWGGERVYTAIPVLRRAGRVGGWTGVGSKRAANPCDRERPGEAVRGAVDIGT